jgi:DNA-binding response OmpR family regulator
MNPSLKVMIVDDDAVALEVAAAVLEDRGYRVLRRDSALGTLLAIRREKPDVVLLDVHMPGLNGDALSKLVMEANSARAPIIILHSVTAAAELDQLATACAAAGAIEKTADPGAFLQRFQAIVARAQGEIGKRNSAPSARKK